jgi:metal-dependent amidase/aminoacylase/carboxypeptidase family protein
MVIRRINEIATHTAEAAGATVTIELPYSLHYPVTFNNVALTNRMLPSLYKTAGEGNVHLVPARTGSEDFSFFSEKIPGFFFFLGGMPKGKDPALAGPHHTPQFYIDESGFKLGINALCNLVFDYENGAK